MLRGNLTSSFQPRRDKTGSPRSSPRGSRGNRRRSYVGPGHGQGAADSPFGPLVTEFKPAIDITRVKEARITNCSYATSYSISNEQQPYKLIVPGQPASWKPPLLPHQLPSDNGNYIRDLNSALFPIHPAQPTVQALFALNPAFDPSHIDIVGCASSMGDILRFARCVDSTFRYDIDMVGNTMFLIRSSKNNIIHDVRGYGHTFLDGFTSHDESAKNVKSHQRIVSYDFFGFRCLVRFECDAHLPSEEEDQQQQTSPDLDISSPPPPGSITIEKGGVLIPQESVIEVKTRAHSRGAIEKKDHLPRLWIRQVPQFITAYHNQGVFENFLLEDLSQELVDWETEHQDELKRFGTVLRQLISEVKRMSHLKLEIYRAGLGPLQLRERRGANTNWALPRVWEDRWISRTTPGPGREGSGGRDDSDDESAGYPSRASSEEPEGSVTSDFVFDYTDCCPDCGYCGRCS